MKTTVWIKDREHATVERAAEELKRYYGMDYKVELRASGFATIQLLSPTNRVVKEYLCYKDDGLWTIHV